MMNRWLRHFSIKKKLYSVQFVSSVVAFCLATVMLFVLEVSEFKRNTQDDLISMVDLIANRSTAALLFDDPALVKENLASLEQLSAFRYACVYSQSGNLYTSLSAVDFKVLSCPLQYDYEKTAFQRTHLHVYQPILLDDEQLGTIYVFVDLEQRFIRKLQSVVLLVSVLFGVSLLAFISTLPLLQVITRPLQQLLDTVNKITRDKNYTRRAVKRNDDEIGRLVDAFNEMLGTVEYQNRALVVARDHYVALYDDNPTMVFNLTTTGTILSVNHFGAKQLAMTAEDLRGQSIFDFIHPDDQKIAANLLAACIREPQQVHKHELRKCCRSGHILWVRETARLVTNENGRITLLVVCEDVTENRLLTEKITFQANHDALTGLTNRRYFDVLLQQALAGMNPSMQHTLCYLDLDQFKVVNDTCGHLAGDELLKQLGDVIKQQIRKEDVLARLGGDEFGILMRNCTACQAKEVCEKIKNSIREYQFAWQGRSFSVGVSIGIASIDESTGNAVELLKQADSACYAAKEKGRNRVHLFRLDDAALAARQGEMRWVEKLQQCINNNCFVLYGQLIVPIAESNEGLSFETLIRYQDEQGNIIPPGAFLPAAERYNMAVALDQWVVEHLFQWFADHSPYLHQLSKCSVNLSGLSLSDESMLSFIMDCFERYAIPKRKICFEITETAAIANLADATRFIEHFREQGCSFSLDDFGSGLSSFAYLKNLPVDYLKIDGLFVKDILDDPIDLAMVRSINDVGHVMQKKTIAEFVENQQVFDLLHELGVDYAQGYGVAKPVPLDELKW